MTRIFSPLLCTIALLAASAPARSQDEGSIGHWPLDEGSGTVAGDLSPLPVDGTLLNGSRTPTWSTEVPLVPSPGSFSLWFDGIDDGVNVNVVPYHATTNTFTIAFWAKPELERDSTAESVTGEAGYAGQQRYAIFPTPAGASSGLGHTGAGVSVGTNGVSVFEWEQMGHFPSLLVHDAAISGWVHVAVVFNAKQPLLYLDGVLVKTGLTSTKTVHPSPNMGRKGDASFGAYGGFLDEVRIYDRALAESEILSLAERESTPSPSPSASPSPSPSPEPETPSDASTGNGACAASPAGQGAAVLVLALVIAAAFKA